MENESHQQVLGYKTLVLGCSTILFLCIGYGQDFPVECIRVGSTPEANASTLRAVAFDSDRFVAVGDGGIIVLSTNATNWLRQPSPTTSNLYGLTFGLGRFVAVGDAGRVLQSMNGSTWLAATVGATNNFRAAAFGNGTFVALTANSKLMRSYDATNWEVSTNGVPVGWSLYGLYFGGGLFVCSGTGGTILISSDGQNWTNTSVSTYSTFTCGAYGNGVFITAGWGEFGADQVARSSNGVAWTTSRHSLNYNTFCFGGGLLVGVGGSTAQWSSDGSTWTNAYIGSINGLSVAFGLGQYVVVGNGGAIFGSTDLATWTQRNATVCPIAATSEGNGVVVGISGNYGMIYSSEDNVHFTRRRDPGGILVSIDFCDGVFATVGNVGIWVSTNGTNWTVLPQPAASETLWSIRNEDGVWVAVGRIIITSADATNWTTRISNAGYLTGLIYGDNRFVSFGWDGVIWSSPDGINWFNHSYPTGADFGPGVFQDGLFSLYAPASFMQSPMGVISMDGTHWFDSAVSGPLLSLRSDNASGSLKLALAGEWGRNYLVQCTTNHVGWFNLQTITNSAGVASVSISNSTSTSRAFFRALTQ